MVRGDRDLDTIFAVSTPHGVGGISVIRISGPAALVAIKSLAKFLPEQIESHKVYFGTLVGVESREDIDEVLVTFFKEGRSFTGEEVIEVSCHGNPLICRDICNELVGRSLRAADRGEFTYRAFINGRMDLVQAESVLSLIESQSRKAANLALRQLKGAVSSKVEKIENDIIWILARTEVGIDFSTEDIEVFDVTEISRRLALIEKEISELVSSFKYGRVIRDGIHIVLSGRPNVGKSSLLNALVEEEKAIVTDIAGTTRDIIQGETSHIGQKIVFLDTAGFRANASDLVERIGIEKSQQARNAADVVAVVLDAASGFGPEDISILEGVDPENLVVLVNKMDEAGSEFKNESVYDLVRSSKVFNSNSDLEAFLKSRVFFVSALDKKVREKILGPLMELFSKSQPSDQALISSARHFENLSRALLTTQQARAVVETGLGAEFLAIELKEALIAVQVTLGKQFDDEVMDKVFRDFCIGK